MNAAFHCNNHQSQTECNPWCETQSLFSVADFFFFFHLKGYTQLLLVCKQQTNKVVFTAISFVADWFTSPITHQGLVCFHTMTQGLWPIITTYYSGKWIPHICFQWMARLTLLLAYSILLHKPLANRCLCWSEWTLKLRPAAALWEQVKFACQPPRGRLSPTLFIIVRS